MTGNFKLTGAALDVPTVVAEDTTVLVRWDGMAFRCSADAAHILSDDLFRAALAVESRLAELDSPAPE